MRLSLSNRLLIPSHPIPSHDDYIYHRSLIVNHFYTRLFALRAAAQITESRVEEELGAGESEAEGGRLDGRAVMA